jgi:cadmium resistance protein CadD (predicted permease)
MDALSLLGLAVAVFVSTNVDDIFLLSAFFADGHLRPRSIVAGQFLGIGVLVAASTLAALAALVVPEGWIALLGLVPLGLGVRGLPALRRGAEDEAEEAEILARERKTQRRTHSQALAISGVTIANGGDNLGVYIPLFASRPAAIPVYAVAFAILTALWCAMGYLLVNNRWLGAPLRRYGHVLLPFVLIGLGLYILSGARVLVR